MLPAGTGRQGEARGRAAQALSWDSFRQEREGMASSRTSGSWLPGSAAPAPCGLHHRSATRTPRHPAQESSVPAWSFVGLTPHVPDRSGEWLLQVTPDHSHLAWSLWSQAVWVPPQGEGRLTLVLDDSVDALSRPLLSRGAPAHVQT